MESTPPVPAPLPAAPVAGPRPSHAWVWALVALVVAAAAGAGWWYFRAAPSGGPQPTDTAAPRVSHVRWQEPEKLGDLGYVPVVTGIDPPSYTKVGTFTAGPYAGGDLVLLIAPQEGPGWAPAYRFARTAAGAALLERHSDVYWAPEEFKPPFTADADYVIPDLDFPEFLNSPWDDVALQKQGVFGFFGYRFWNELDEAGLVQAFMSDYGPVFTDRTHATPTPTPGPDVPYTPKFYGFYVKGPDGSVFTYAPRVGFLTDGHPRVRWDNNAGSYGEYVTFRVTGCGQQSYADVIPAYEVDPARDLRETGRTEDGSPVYEFSDSRHPMLTQAYEEMYVPEPVQKIEYGVFVGMHPIFFWKDPLGRLVKFQAKDILPPTECGKPVIYLYPEQTGEVSVQVRPQGGMSVSDPAYGDGWSVIAHPDGRLFHPGTGREYPYLFWEGRGGIYRQPERGWTVRRSEVSGFLDEKLALLGLNGNEIADFKEFWLPRMEDAPYYFVTFLGNREMEVLAPLSVVPAPDTVIRVLMDFSPLQEPRTVVPFDIRTPKRSGFTVVEWGGVLR